MRLTDLHTHHRDSEGNTFMLNCTPENIEAALRKAKEYADRIEIHIGFEAEYYPALFDELLAEIKKKQQLFR